MWVWGGVAVAGVLCLIVGSVQSSIGVLGQYLGWQGGARRGVGALGSCVSPVQAGMRNGTYERNVTRTWSLSPGIPHPTVIRCMLGILFGKGKGVPGVFAERDLRQ